MTVRLMLDSGAFGVWSNGGEIKLEDYIAFCQAHPLTTYYIVLDVISGTKQTEPTKEQIEAAAKASWLNHRRMCKELPAAKVMPVYHIGDDIRWLQKYLDRGVTYIGLGFDPGMNREAWLKTLKPYLFDGAGRPTVRTHGLGVGASDVMRYWQWHSVDSTSWKYYATWGWILMPRKTRGVYDYSLDPHIVRTSPIAKAAPIKQKHFCSMSPFVREEAMAYLASEGLVMGEWKIDTVSADYKIPRMSEEFWYDKKKRLLLRTVVKGVATSFEERARANCKFMRKAEKVLPIDHIYLAGMVLPYPLEVRMTNRLLSYFDLRKASGHVYMKRHTDTMEK